MTAPAHPPTSPEPTGDFQEIADGVYAYTHQDRNWCVSNTGAIAGPRSITLIDSTATAPRARRFLQAVRTTSANPIARLVITHHHGDHHYGAQELITADTAVISHTNTADSIRNDGLHLKDIWPDTDWGDISPVLPTLTFTDRLTIEDAGPRVELLHWGTAHTTGDIVAWIPQHRVLFAGDLVFNGATPFVLMGSVSGTLTTLEHLRALKPQVVIPGHGPVAGPEIIDANIAYLAWLQRTAEETHAAGMSPLEAALSVDLGPFVALGAAERNVGNWHRAYAEIEGHAPGWDLPLQPVLEEMIAYNGGRPLICDA